MHSFCNILKKPSAIRLAEGFLFLLILLVPSGAKAGHRILTPDVKSLQVVVNDDWLAPLPVMTLGSGDVLNVAFDQLSHDYHRYVYHIEHCEADWSRTEDLFEADWLEGFNDNPIEDYEHSMNTTVPYTHYSFQIPNDRCRLKLSGNYRITVVDEEADNAEVLTAEFMVLEDGKMTVGLSANTNTDIDHNNSHQQVAMTVNYNGTPVTNLEEQLSIVVMQNGRADNAKRNVKPNYVTNTGLKWEHNRALIFEAGNEYHKYEILDVSHTTMGLAYIHWNQDEGRYHAFPLVVERRRNYLLDEDANGAFYIRNSDNFENDRVSDYVYVHYKLLTPYHYDNAQVFIDGQWTIEAPETYVMSYDENDQSYNATILQKQGYYNYQLLMRDMDGTTHRMPEEGSFYQTENRYEALVYYKGTGERTWRLLGYQEIVAKFK